MKTSHGSRDPLKPGFANQYPVESAPFLAPWSLWKGQGWGAMDQGPQELTVPDGLDSLGDLGPAGSQSWLTSRGGLRVTEDSLRAVGWTSSIYTR